MKNKKQIFLSAIFSTSLFFATTSLAEIDWLSEGQMNMGDAASGGSFADWSIPFFHADDPFSAEVIEKLSNQEIEKTIAKVVMQDYKEKLRKKKKKGK